MKMVKKMCAWILRVVNWGEQLREKPTYGGMLFRLFMWLWYILLLTLLLVGLFAGLIGFGLAKIMNGLYWLRYGPSVKGKFNYLNFLEIGE